MRLTGNSGDAFELDVVGYEFPEITEGGDSNWLNVRVKGTAQSRSWTATDPCLETGEVAELADWFEAVLAGKERDKKLEFLEPNLSFELTGRDDDRFRIRVWIEVGSRPSWAKSDLAGECDLYIDLDTTIAELQAASRSLREQLERWPPRP